jgi:flagellin-like hook-associated protein FlgL
VAPTGPATLTLTGIDDEWLDLNPIAVKVNGQQVFSGASPFANWDGATTGAAAAWTPVTITIAPELKAGRNRITVANLSPTGNVGSPPYVLLDDASLQAPGATVIVPAPESDAQSEDMGQEGGQGDGDPDNG